MTIPTLETNAGATLLRIEDGTSGNHVAFDDVWNWPDGVSAGNGDVPIDGGGTAKVNTFLTETVANRMYTIEKDLQIGDGSSSTFFRSVNEQVYFQDAATFTVTSAATLELGILENDWGINGSAWSFGPTANYDIIASGASTANFNMFASSLHLRSLFIVDFEDGDLDWRNSQFTGEQTASSSQRLRFQSGINSLNMADVYFNNMHTLNLSLSPAAEDFHFHEFQSFESNANVSIGGYLATDAQSFELRATGLNTITLVNPKFVPSLIRGDDASSQEIVDYTVDVHISDSAGTDLASATVAMESFGNIVSNDGGSTFYRCIVDHTAGTFATDLAANKWELTTAAIAAKAGVTGVTAITGAWVTGTAYVKSASLFSVSTDASGDITQQTENYKKWIGTSEALLSYAPYQITISKATYETLVASLVAPLVIDGANQPLVEHFELLPPGGGGIAKLAGDGGGLVG